jgi:hypothetical protein
MPHRASVRNVLIKAAKLVSEKPNFKRCGSDYIHAAAVWLTQQALGRKAEHLYADLYTPDNRPCFYFNNSDEVTLALLFAAEFADEEPVST